MTRKLSRSAAALLLIPALLLGACGQTPVTTQPPVTDPVSATLVVTFLIPSAPPAQAQRPQYLSSATTNLRVQLGSLDTTLALSAATCTPAQGGQSCTFTLNVTPGANQTLSVSAYSASSQLLSTSTSTVSILAGQANALSLTLTGVAASATVTPTDRPGDLSGPANSLLLDLGGSYTLGIALKDASGQTILNPGRPTETVTSSNAAFTVTSTGVGTFSVVAPDPTGTAQTTTLTISSAGGTSLATQLLTVPAEKLTLSLSNTAPVAGSSVVAMAKLTSARGQALKVAGRTVTFATTDGTVTANPPTAQTDAAGAASLNILTGPNSGVTGTVGATSDGVSASATYTSVNGSANTTTSTVTLTPASVKVGGTSSLVVTLKDANGNPVTAVPVVTVSGKSTLGSPVQSGNVFTYPVTAGSSPETATFTVSSGGSTVGSVNLLVTAYPLGVSDGWTVLVSGAQYDFQNSAAHSFAVMETGYTGTFTVTSSNPAVATASISGGALSVTPGTTAGFSTIKVSDANGQSFSFIVSVTTANLIIN